MEERNDEKKQILPKMFHKKEKAGRKKMRLEFEQTASLLGDKKNRHDYKGHDKANNNDHTVVPLEAMDEEPQQEEPRQKFFGVKNYLHNFYESVSIKNPQLYEDIPDESAANPPFKETKNCRLCWKVGIAIGLTMAFVGLVLILVGFVTPLHSAIAAKNEEFLIIDRSATIFNDYMRMCRLVGIGLFLTGFCLFLAVVLFALCWNIDENNGEPEDEESSSDNFCLTLHTETTYQKAEDKKIPVTEELATVQPKREKEEEVIVTKSGLITPPPAVLQIKSEK